MKKSKKILIITASVMIFAGALISLGAMIQLNFDFDKINSDNLSENVYTINKDFSNIYVNDNDCDIRFFTSDSKNCKVVCDEGDDVYYSVSVENDTLNVIKYDNSKWYNHIFFSFSRPSKLDIYLPYKVYNNLNVENVSGGITTENYFHFNSVNIKNISGNIYFNSNVIENIDVLSVSGNIDICQLVCKNINITSTSGDIKLTSAEAQETLYMKSISGNIDINNSDANELHIKNTSGNVYGSLLSEKNFIIDTFSGDVDVPNSGSEENCEISTVSGNIRINIV